MPMFTKTQVKMLIAKLQGIPYVAKVSFDAMNNKWHIHLNTEYYKDTEIVKWVGECIDAMELGVEWKMQEFVDAENAHLFLKDVSLGFDFPMCLN